MNAVLEIRAVAMIRRRELLQRDTPVDFKAMIEGWRKAGWSTAQICFVLNVSRGALWYWESGTVTPNYEDGRAMVKLNATILNLPL